MATSFEAQMRNDVAAIASEESVSTDRAFSVWYCQVVLRLDRQESLEASRFDGGNDQGIDILHVDDERQQIVIAQSKSYKSANRAPSPAELALLLDTVDVLADPHSLRDDGRYDLAEAADDVAAARTAGYPVLLHLAYPGPSRPTLEAKVRGFNRARTADGITAHLVPLSELQRQYHDFKGLAGRVPFGRVALAERGVIEQTGPYGAAIVATISGKSLRDLFLLHGNRLFDQNVRLFVGARSGSVNAAIEETIESSSDRQNFWAYNNGITVVAESFKRRPVKQEIELRKFSIVNGCQTTVLIGRSAEQAARDIRVLARIVAAPPNLVDSIIKYTNSQTPIRIWEMSARDADQQRLRRDLEQLPEPWFYAFRRGEFDSVSDKTKFGPANRRRILPFPQSVQRLAAFRGLPVEAYKDKGRLFTTHKDKVLPSSLAAHEILWAWHVGDAVERALKKQRGVLAEDENLTQDDQTALILRRGAAYFVASIAAQLLADRNGVDFTSRIDTARLTDVAMRARLDKYATVALVYYLRATRTRLKNSNDLGIVLRSPETNADLRRYTREELTQEKLAPDSLREKLPVLTKRPK